MTEEDGIKEEIVEISGPKEFIVKNEPRLRENDEEAYEEVVTISKVSSEGKVETTFAHTTEETTVTPKFLNKEKQGAMTTPKY